MDKEQKDRERQRYLEMGWRIMDFCLPIGYFVGIPTLFIFLSRLGDPLWIAIPAALIGSIAFALFVGGFVGMVLQGIYDCFIFMIFGPVPREDASSDSENSSGP